MSGIAGVLHLDGSPATDTEIGRMVSLLERRGPEGARTWQNGPIGFGHTLLATTPEAQFERLPLQHTASGCVITADVRLDNRQELLSALGLLDVSRSTGDAEIILEAYLKWGEICPERFLGDFVFAIWDPRTRKLFCGRDHFGVKPFNYHHSAGRIFAFASEPRAILLLEQVPHRINEGRIADFLVTQLEGIDKTSTFFEEVYRLPPAHTLTITVGGMQLQRYWRLEPGPELHLASDQAYADAFLDVFTEAVRCRLRSAGPVGSMLSGGMDSGSVVAVARELLAENGRGPLPTFSAVAPDPKTCIETRTIQAALAMSGLDPHTISYGQLGNLSPALENLTWNLDEPFDSHMTLVRAVYVMARQQQVKVVLDGIDGDTVLSEGSFLTRLARDGHFWVACREVVGQKRFWGKEYSTLRELSRCAWQSFAPAPVKRLRRDLCRDLCRVLCISSRGTQVEENIRSSIIHPAFARRVDLADRLRTLEGHRPQELLPSLRQERILAVDHPYLTVGIERYDRTAAAVGVEPRHPFLDRRVVELCMALPAGQKLHDGWPKAILRRAMAGRLPDAVRWRVGKQHLGWSFTAALMDANRAAIQRLLHEHLGEVVCYIDSVAVQEACEAYFEGRDSSQASKVYEAAHLISWLLNQWADQAGEGMGG